jgi:uncharacterized membrane protein required for colicin V production
MNVIDIIIVILIVLSFLGGLVQGVIKSFFSLIALIIAIPVAGACYPYLAGALSFMPGTDWENFSAFFIIMVIVSIILHIIFFFPSAFINKVWVLKGPLFRLLGGVLNLIGTLAGLVLFATIVQAYPVMDWLEDIVSESGIITWLLINFNFVKFLLPDMFSSPGITVFARYL